MPGGEAPHAVDGNRLPRIRILPATPGPPRSATTIHRPGRLIDHNTTANTAPTSNINPANTRADPSVPVSISHPPYPSPPTANTNPNTAPAIIDPIPSRTQ